MDGQRGKSQTRFETVIQRWAMAAPIFCCLFSLLSLVACEGKPTGDAYVDVAGTVQERTTLARLENVRVRLVDDGIDISVDTDSNGVFSISYLGRTYIRDGVLMFRKAGYLPYDTVLDRVEYGVWDLKVELESVQ